MELHIDRTLILSDFIQFWRKQLRRQARGQADALMIKIEEGPFVWLSDAFKSLGMMRGGISEEQAHGFRHGTALELPSLTSMQGKQEVLEQVSTCP